MCMCVWMSELDLDVSMLQMVDHVLYTIVVSLSGMSYEYKARTRHSHSHLISSKSDLKRP